MPRDIEPEVGELDDVYLYSVDDLHEVVAENLKSRQGAAQAAEELVGSGVAEFMQRLRELAAVDVLRAYRQQAERLRDEELGKAQRQLANGADPAEVMAQLARGLTNKLLHAPSADEKCPPRAASTRWPWPRSCSPSTRRAAPLTGTYACMKASLLKKLDVLSDRYEELTALLGDAEVISDQTRFRAYSREYAEVEPVILAFRDYRKVQADLEGAQALLKDSDPELRDLAEEEVAEARGRLAALGDSLQRMLLPKDPNDSRNVFLEIRAGTGGDEAAIFSGDLFRMYSRYAERQGWRVETLSENEGEHGGYKEVIARVEGDNVYAKLKFESGAHRAAGAGNRIPGPDPHFRLHCRGAAGAGRTGNDRDQPGRPAGGHLPAPAARQQDRLGGAHHPHSQRHRGRVPGRALAAQEPRQGHGLAGGQAQRPAAGRGARAIASTRKLLVGSGDRSERIRTYNFPQGRVTDHRINLTLYSLGEVMEGAVEQVIEPLLQEYQADQLAALGD